ncbi:conserved hypothetical protein [uncultured Desulfobacterium sp.]|uniref:tRNA (guanine-N(1)-)-methyltransferase C-terminal domain-containing protein n=1 Tax=uncultured Desulfobacterium sp. TaxID=201089 RepID=A0A445MXM1_9BACT|nr:conserved hypothetical protein [uncultured Desulfobacterium sp.]
MRLYVGLVHYPVYNKNFETIASAVTTFDLHDIARVARTYDVRRFFVITPLEDQRALVKRVIGHWTGGYGARYNQDRKDAISLVEIVASIEEAMDIIRNREGEAPLLIATDASRQKIRSISYMGARKILQDEKAVLLIFGTAWGLDKAVLAVADYVLDPITGRTGYQHLSVRSAAAIILDRLAGREESELEE